MMTSEQGQANPDQHPGDRFIYPAKEGEIVVQMSADVALVGSTAERTVRLCYFEVDHSQLCDPAPYTVFCIPRGKWVCVDVPRPFNAYGPGELPDAEPGIAHAVPDLIREGALGPASAQIFGSGEQTRTLTHVDDIADGIVTALGHPAAGTRTSTSRPPTSARRGDRPVVWEACGATPPSSSSAPAELRGRRAAALAVRREGARLLGWEAQIDIETGIADTVRWLREQQEVAR